MDKFLLKPGVRITLFLIFPLCVFITLLTVSVFCVLPVKTASLQRSVSAVLQAKYGNAYQVGEFVRTQEPLAASSAVFLLTSRRGAKNYTHAVLVRMTGLSGPVCGVFLYAASIPCEFAGLAGIADTQDTPFKYGVTASLLRFWESKLPALCGGEVL